MASTTPAAAPPAIAAMGTSLLDLLLEELSGAAVEPAKRVVVIIVSRGMTCAAKAVGVVGEDIVCAVLPPGLAAAGGYKTGEGRAETAGVGGVQGPNPSAAWAQCGSCLVYLPP